MLIGTSIMLETTVRKRQRGEKKHHSLLPLYLKHFNGHMHIQSGPIILLL